ncbi:helix-turn-helix transcriptional regulator [Brasilonema sp. UFV-L1]|nr:helix-turn-helix transcriptional regulator [Brasilonema sp. UFV-L1]
MKQLRQRADLKAEQVAAHIGVAHSSVRNWEQGRTIPKLRIDQVGDLLRLYQCTFEELEQAVKESISNYEKSNKD